jgi:DNA invertase Pin-like site-specific DNA recombinase
MRTATITARRQERLAYVYVRQSTLWQVSEHQESTERQYRLQERARELGWPPTAIAVIDEDQGRSGSSATARTGFQRLVSQVSLGQVGIVLMLEASRLARNSSDWHRLIELCGVSHTVLADETAVSDPRDPNDRLLLGVKGTLSEAELFTLRTRLSEGRWNKARKGLLRFALPVGYVAAPDGQWDLDPDQQVRERLAYLFATFRRNGVARQVVRGFRQQGLDLPVRSVSKGVRETAVEGAHVECRGAHPREPRLRGDVCLRPVGVSGGAALAHDGQSAAAPTSGGRVGSGAAPTSSCLCHLGSLPPDPGTVAAKLAARRGSGRGPRRHSFVARDRLVRVLWMQDGGPALCGERKAFARLPVSTGAPAARGRADLPKHDRSSRGCGGDPGLPGSRLPAGRGGGGPGARAGGAAAPGASWPGVAKGSCN